MADTTALKNRIRAAIKSNDNQEITGPVLQQALLDIVDELDLNPELENEAQQRRDGDSILQQNITTLQGVVNGIVANIQNGYVYAGIATPSTTPASGKVFYLALTAGTYTNFGSIVVPQGINILKYNGSAWSLESFIGLDDAPTAGSDNLVKSGGVAAKIAELDYLKSELQKAITFKEIPFISLDSTPNHLYPNDSETSRFVGVICRPLRNAKYRYQYWHYGHESFIRYYKGNVNTDAKCVYNDANSMLNRTEFVTPDADFDFAVINLKKSLVLSYPINSFYALSIETSDISDGAVTTNKLEDGAVTTDKLEGLNLFEYCLNACNGFTPNLDDFTNLTDDEDSWTTGLLKNNGEVDTAIGEGRNYKVSKYVDYDAPYGQPYSVLYANMNMESYSNPYVQVAFYKKNDHSFVKAFQCVGYKRLILIPRGYSIRVSSRQVGNPSLYFSATIHNLKTIESVISNVQSSVDNLTSVVSEVKETTDEITSDSTVETETYTNEVNPSTDNVEILNNKIWADYGKLVDSSKFNTFRLVIPSHTTSVNLSNYNIGVYNGGFLTEDETWIKGINNKDNMSEVEIPTGAYYIDVTFEKTITRVVIFNLEKNIYNLPNIRLNVSQIDGSTKNNQWYGKKICIIGTSVAHGSNAETAYGYIAQQKLGFTMIPAGVPGQAIHGKKVSYIENGVQKTILSPLTYGSGSLTKDDYAIAKAVRDAGLSTDVIGMTINESPNNPDNWAGESKPYNNYYRTWENLFTEENQDVALWIYATVPNNNNFALDDWNNFDTSSWKYKDGTSFDEHRTTFLGAMLYLMDKMYNNQPKARMILVLDSAFDYSDSRGKGNMELLSKTFNIPLIDLWGKMNTSPKSLLYVRSKNGTDTHPSTFGQERMGDIFTNELLLVS